MKQIANEMGIPKQKVYRYVKANHIRVMQENEARFLFDEAAEALIKQHFAKNIESQSHHNDASKDTIISLLENELEFRNEQIKTKDKLIGELTNQLRETTTALVSAQQSASAAQALHAGTIQTQLIETNLDGKRNTPIKDFFRRIFRSH